ncbi:Uncharacterised protein [Candidatus Gugararchaeum adminiculabundum]|nr:Uncharacterised protein [Candidatus Gugararchaeum adminiculabundum]
MSMRAVSDIGLIRRRKFSPALALLILLTFFAFSAWADGGVSTTTGPYSECPPGASYEDCFNCGAPPKGVACTTKCTAEYACTCGYDWCECYCPYSGTGTTAPDNTDTNTNNNNPPADPCANVQCSPVCTNGKLYGSLCVSGQCQVYMQTYTTCENGCASNGIECASALPPPPAHPDLCAGVECPDKCDSPRNNFATALRQGQCDSGTGECVYQDKETCQIGCSLDGNKKAVCQEDCDNSIDDDGNGLVDCADPVCADSLSCTCKKVASVQGSIGGKPLVILMGGYQYADTTFIFNYKNRDAMTLVDANKIAETLKATAPFNQMSFELYASRINLYNEIRRTGRFENSRRAALLAKCGEQGIGGDLTIMVNYLDGTSLPYSRAFSMNAEIFRGDGPVTRSDFELDVLHELGHAFAGLWDEYTVAEGVGFFTGVGATIRDYGFAKRSNCAVADDPQYCNDYFSRFNVSFTCVRGCDAGAWYRSSQESLMNNVYASSEYNAVSQKIIKDRIQAFAHPKAIVIYTPKSTPGRNPEPAR